VDHLPSSGVKKTMGPSWLDSNMAWAALVGGHTYPPACFKIYPVIAINLDDNSTLPASFELLMKRLRKLTLSLSRKLCWREPMTLAKRTISVGLFVMQSENSNEIYSYSIDFPARRLTFVRSIELVRHFLKMNWSSSQMVTLIMRER